MNNSMAQSLPLSQSHLPLPEQKLARQSPRAQQRRAAPRRAVHGWLNLHKAEGASSAQAVAQVRQLFGARKVGHAGTLDPLASGVLPLAFGAATKTIQFMQNASKTYEIDIQWGASTSTDDREGTITNTSPHVPTMPEVKAALPQFIGTIQQVPPQFSAIRQKGQRAYAVARAGGSLVLAARAIRIDAIDIVRETRSNAQICLRVVCGKGTYMRALARDLALHLGTYGHVARLQRIKVGVFCQKSIITLESLHALRHSAPASAKLVALDACLLPIETVLDDIPAVMVGEAAAMALRHGQVILPTALLDASSLGADDKQIRVHDANGIIALCRYDAAGIYPIRVLNFE